MITKNDEKVIGETVSKEKNCIDRKLVSYWNLIRSYILLHCSDKIVVFFADGLGDNSDFLNYSSINEFNSEKDMQDFYDKIKNKNLEGLVLIRSVNGNILD